MAALVLTAAQTETQFHTVVELFGYAVPRFVFIPNLPFELAIGVWLVVKGTRDGSETK